MSVLNNRITYLLTYIYMRDTTLLLIYYGPVLNAPAIFELVVVRWCYARLLENQLHCLSLVELHN